MDLTVVPFPDMNTAAVASPHRSVASHPGTAGRCKESAIEFWKGWQGDPKDILTV